jgi:methionyl-tRNA formyltransferase
VDITAKIRTVFFSDLDSPFGVPHLFELLDTARCEVVAVVLGRPGVSETGGKMPVVNRWGQAVSRDLLGATARAHIPVLQPARIGGGELVSLLRPFSPDLLVSAGFRRILPPEVLAVPAKAAVNLHPSRLPRVRGMDPWFWTLAIGEAATAVTVHHMAEAVDAGDIVLQVPVCIDGDETASSLRHKTTVESLRLIAPLIEAASRGPLPRQPQDLSTGSIFPEPSDQNRTLDWTAPATTVHRLVRASLATPGATTSFRQRTVRVLDAELGTNPELWTIDAPPGTVLNATMHGVAVKAGEGHVVLRQLQADGSVLPAVAIVGLPGGEGARDRFC